MIATIERDYWALEHLRIDLISPEFGSTNIYHTYEHIHPFNFHAFSIFRANRSAIFYSFNRTARTIYSLTKRNAESYLSGGRWYFLRKCCCWLFVAILSLETFRIKLENVVCPLIGIVKSTWEIFDIQPRQLIWTPLWREHFRAVLCLHVSLNIMPKLIKTACHHVTGIWSSALLVCFQLIPTYILSHRTATN